LKLHQSLDEAAVVQMTSEKTTVTTGGGAAAEAAVPVSAILTEGDGRGKSAVSFFVTAFPQCVAPQAAHVVCTRHGEPKRSWSPSVGSEDRFFISSWCLSQNISIFLEILTIRRPTSAIFDLLHALLIIANHIGTN
jgi:hypothetical protein